MRISLLVAGLAIFGTTMTNAQGACFGDSDCTNGATCVNRVCTGGGSSSGGDKGKDEACSLDAECTSGLCNTSERKCWGYTDQRCFNNLCSAQQHTVCVSRFCKDGDLLYGARCTDNALCASGQCATTCAGAKVDSPCTANGECRSFLCKERLCAPAKVGSPCETARDCSSGTCGASRFCVAGAPQDDGTTCAVNGECKSGSCDIPADERDRPSTCVAQSSPTAVPGTAPPTNAPPTAVPGTAPPTAVPGTAPPTAVPGTAPPTLPPSAAVFPTSAPPTTAPPTTAPPTTAPPTPASPTQAPGPDDFWCEWFGYCSGSTPTPPPTAATPPPTTPPTSSGGGWNSDCFFFGIGC